MSLPIIERHPGFANLPRVALCDLPTPAEALDLPGEIADRFHALYVKRDDLTSAAYGGNKVRKLEFLLGEAIEQGARTTLTFGAYGSNHALATAVFSRRLGLEPHAVLSPQAPGPFAAATLRAHAGLGTVIHLVDGWDGAREAVRAKQALERRDGIAPCVIPMGGTSALGAMGYVNAAFELVAQAHAGERPVLGGLLTMRGDGGAVIEPDVVYVAAGTLGTAVGLAIGFAAAGLDTRVVATRVTPDSVATDAIAEKLAADTIALARSLDAGFPPLTPVDLALELRHDWFEPGYGVVTPETTEAVELARAAGLTLETTYTGKAFAAMIADARAGDLLGSHVVFWDTYNSAPMPQAGPVAALPAQLREYVAQCDRLFGT
ncbi:MAG: pyridoxal-phosphate dependent enzyme [Coriobacteriia bacterium]|nr:pyridoxal-phosphate dependent enzyme [Coriobacteriia bacterium]